MIFISDISLPLRALLFNNNGLWGTHMEFGVYIRGAKTYPKMLELSRAAEELDYYGVFVNDHVEGFLVTVRNRTGKHGPS